MLVYARFDRRAKFHKTKFCPQLLKRPPKGVPQTLVTIDINDIANRRPCRYCYPDVPRVDVIHRPCSICNQRSARPCAHNGGVRVYLTRTRREASLFLDANETYTRYDYVWPENLRFYL